MVPKENQKKEIKDQKRIKENNISLFHKVHNLRC